MTLNEECVSALQKSDSLHAYSQVQRVVEDFPENSASVRMFEPWLGSLACKVHGARQFECFANWRMLPRRLPNDVIFYVIQGRGQAKISSGSHRLRPGVCLHLPRGMEHEATHDPRHPLHVVLMHYTALADFSLALSDLVTMPVRLDLDGDPVIPALLRDACHLAALGTDRWERSLDAIGLVLLLRLIRHCGEKIQPVHASRLSDLSRIAPALRTMRECCTSDRSVEAYAAIARLSPPQFRRVFRSATSMSPNQFLQNLRVEKAASLLRSSQATIEAVSDAVGYSDPSFFSRAFKKAIGMPPGAYRDRMDLME